MEPLTLIVLVQALVAKVTDLVAFVSAQDWKAAAKQALAYVAGVAALFGVKAGDLFTNQVIPGFDETLSDLNGWGTMVVGVMLASVAGQIRDFVNARDANSSAYVPPLGGPPDTTPPPG